MRDLDRAIREMNAQSTLFSHAIASRLRLSSSDLECLDLLQLGDGATAGDLARATGLTTGAITGVIDRLEKARYVRREADRTDRRKVIVRVRAAGIKRLLPLYHGMSEAMGELWSSYSDDELSLMLDFMKKSSAVVVGQIGKVSRTKLSTGRAAKPA